MEVHIKEKFVPEQGDPDIVVPKVVDIQDLRDLRRTDLNSFLDDRGYTLIPQRNGTFKVNELTEVYTSADGRRWESNLFHKGGNAIDFLMRFERMNYEEAVESLKGVDDIVKYDLPERAASNDKISNYLINDAGINKTLVDDLLQKGAIYQARENDNLVFTSMDQAGNVHGGFETYKNKNYNSGHYCAVSNRDNAFHIPGSNNTLYVYADPVKLLQHEKNEDHRIFTHHGEAIIHYIKENNIENVVTLDKNNKVIRSLTSEDEMNLQKALIKAKKYTLEKYIKDSGYTVTKADQFYNIEELNLKVNYVKTNYLDKNGKEVIKDKLLNTWYDENRDKEGSTIKLLTDYEKCTYWEAIEKLSGMKTVYSNKAPEHDTDNKPMKKYLKNESITGKRIDKLMEDGRIYWSKDNEIVFKFLDTNGSEHGGYCIDLNSDDKQGQYMERSNLNYSFNVPGTTSSLIVFRNPLDLLKAYASPEYKGDHLILSKGDGSICTYLDDHSGIDKIVFYNQKPDKFKTITAEEEQKIFQGYKKAKETSLYAYLLQSGYKLDYKDGKYTIQGNKDLYIKDDKWYCDSMKVSAGNTLSFVMKQEGYSFRESISIATEDKEIYPVKLPDKTKDSDKLLKYLVFQNGLEKDLAAEMIKKGIIYESTEGKAVYVRKDSRSHVRSAYEQEMKTSYPDGKFVDGSNFKYGFTISGNTQRVLVFRDHQQLLKYENEERKLNKEYGTNLADHKIVALNESTIERFLDENKDVKEVKVIEPERAVKLDRTFDRLSRLLKMFGGNDIRNESRNRFLDIFGKRKKNGKEKDAMQRYLEM